MNKSPLPWSKQAKLNAHLHMARRSIYKILLPAVRFLAMTHALLGLLNYEEKDGRFGHARPASGEHFLFPLGKDQDLANVPRIFNLESGKKSIPNHLEEARESLEEELPEGNVFHLAMPKEAEKRRRRKVVWTPFGEFTVSELLAPFHSLECLRA